MAERPDPDAVLAAPAPTEAGDGFRAGETQADPDGFAEARPRRLRGAFGLGGQDYRVLLPLTLIAFCLRFFSPLMPDLIAHPLTAAPLSNCVRGTPADPAGDAGTLCGLAYPYQKGSLTPGSATRSPAEGEVFDEIYFGVFAHDDLKGTSYFDDKPPVGKLIIAAGEWGWGWFRATFQGARGNPADLGFNTFGWRLMPCLFGTLLVPLMYLLALRLWPDRFFAGVTAFLTCFEGMFFIQSRMAMLDIFVAFFIVLAYWLFLLHLESRTPNQASLTLLLAGVALGLGVATKWSVLGAWAVIVFLLALYLLRGRLHIWLSTPARWWRDPARHRIPLLPGDDAPAFYAATLVLALLVVPAVIYLCSWFPFFLRGQFQTLGDIFNHDYLAYEFNANLKATHPYGSPWYTWPFLVRPVLYYFQYGVGRDGWSGAQLVAGMSDLGNPWIWWTSLPCLLLMPYFVIRQRSFPALLIMLAFTAQYLPWSRVTRVLFLYEMAAALPFMLLALAFVLARAARIELHVPWGRGGIRLPLRELVFLHLALVVAFFAYFYPVWTGLPISDHAYLGNFPGGKIWFPTWI